MGPVEALKMALGEEVKAIKLYENFSLEHKELKDTFVFLVNEEQKHKLLLEKRIAELTRY